MFTDNEVMFMWFFFGVLIVAMLLYILKRSQGYERRDFTSKPDMDFTSQALLIEALQNQQQQQSQQHSQASSDDSSKNSWVPSQPDSFSPPPCVDFPTPSYDAGASCSPPPSFDSGSTNY